MTMYRETVLDSSAEAPAQNKETSVDNTWIFIIVVVLMLCVILLIGAGVGVCFQRAKLKRVYKAGAAHAEKVEEEPEGPVGGKEADSVRLSEVKRQQRRVKQRNRNENILKEKQHKGEDSKSDADPEYDGEGVVEQEVSKVKVAKGQTMNYAKCVACGEMKVGRIYEDDGVHYCDDCRKYYQEQGDTVTGKDDGVAPTKKEHWNCSLCGAVSEQEMSVIDGLYHCSVCVDHHDEKLDGDIDKMFVGNANKTSRKDTDGGGNI